jgi:cysteine-rich repeat protein
VVACGDGKKQPSEECDDGNTSSDDGCSSKCKTERCGDGIKQSKEECDEPGTFTCDMATCKAKADTCTPCERKNCSNYMDMDMDLPKGCYDNMPNPRDVPMQPSEGAFSGPCKKLVACVREEMCLGPESHGYAIDDCYCRRDEIDPGKHFAECDANGPDKCKAEFYAASGTMDPVSATVRHQNPETPAGYAFYLLECDREFCKDECVPWLK